VPRNIFYNFGDGN